MCDVATIGITMAVLSTGLGIAQAEANHQAQVAAVQYQNQADQHAYNMQMLQTTAARTAENQRAQQRDAENQRAEELAQLVRANEVAEINVREQQERAKASDEKIAANREFLQAAGQIRAQGRIGNNVDLLLADVARQSASYDYKTSRNLAFIGQELENRKRVSQGNYATKIAGLSPYQKRIILDPMKPLPRSTPAKNSFLMYGNALVGGIQTGLGAAGAAEQSGLFG